MADFNLLKKQLKEAEDSAKKRVKEEADSARGWSDEDKQVFLKDMSSIESSNGLDLDHKTMTKGMHKGSAAVGRYGMMPKTINEMIHRFKELPKEYSGLSTEQLRSTLSPETEEQIASKLADHVLNRQHGDKEKSAYAWQYGHNLYPENIKQETLDTNERVRKFRALHKLLGQK